MNRLDRLAAILTQLQSKRLTKASEIAARFEISLRTVYRDMRALEEAGVPIIGEAGQGYALVEGYRLPPVMFTKEEALSFLVAEKLMLESADQAVGLHFSDAMVKIKAVLKTVEKDTLEQLANQIEIVGKPVSKSIHPNYLQTLLNALANKQVIQIDYVTFEEEKSSTRQLEAVGIYYSYEKWYVIAWCRLRNDYRNFRLDRIQSIKVLEEVFSTAHPSLKSYLKKVEKKQDLHHVVIHVPKHVYKYIQEEKFHHGFVMELKIDDGYEFTFMTSSLEGLARWLIMLGDHVTVIKPPILHQLILDLLQHMLNVQNEKQTKIPISR